VNSGSLIDRAGERVVLQDALGSHSRVLVVGSPSSEVPAFADWIATNWAIGSKLIRWDFERAPGIEGINILRELADEMPAATRFKAELSAVEDEFTSTPLTHVSQVVGERAEAGNDQRFSAAVNVPTLADYIGRNLSRLAIAFFRDVEVLSEDGHVAILISGIRVGGDDPIPNPQLLDVILSSIWRLAETCSPNRLCVVLAATVSGSSNLDIRGTYLQCDLGIVGVKQAIDAFVEHVDGLEQSEAQAVVLSAVKPGTGGLTYTELRERMDYLALNRLELTAGGTVDA
jgi:hypothetical protein